METLKNTWLTIADHKILTAYLAAIIIFLLTINGCQPRVLSLFEPETMVSRGELLAEVDLFLARAQSRIDELNQKEALLQIITEFTSVSLKTGEFNPSGLLITLLSVLGASTIGNYAGKASTAKKLNRENPVKA